MRVIQLHILSSNTYVFSRVNGPLPPGTFGSILSMVVFKCKQIYLQYRPGLDLGKLPKGILLLQNIYLDT